MVEGKGVGCEVAAEHAEVGRGKGLLLCGRDRFTRRNVDTYLHLENGVNREMPGIPRPPKGGRLGDLGGTNSWQSVGLKGWMWRYCSVSLGKPVTVSQQE